MALGGDVRAVVDASRPCIDGAFCAFIACDRITCVFCEYLIFLHQVIRASVPLMQAAVRAIKVSGATGRSDTADEYIGYLSQHILEEQNHDSWLLSDLQSVGYHSAEVLAREPLREISQLVGAQYYLVAHYDPLALLGYIAALEGSPPTRQNVERLREMVKFPPSGFRTLYAHSEADPGHLTRLYSFLDRLEVNLATSQAILKNAAQTSMGLAKALEVLRASITSNTL